MSPAIAIAKREVKTYFYSPIPYLVASVFIILTGFFCFSINSIKLFFASVRSGSPRGATALPAVIARRSTSSAAVVSRTLLNQLARPTAV